MLRMATAIRPECRQVQACTLTWMRLTRPTHPRRERRDLHRLDEFVLTIDQDRAGAYWRISQLEAHDDDLFALLDQMSGCAVDADHTRSTFSGDHIGFEPRAGRVAHHQYLLSR